MRIPWFIPLVLLAGVRARGQVFSSEFLSTPLLEGWTSEGQFCDPETWANEGWYHQSLDLATCDPPFSEEDRWTLSIEDWNSVAQWFCEFRVETNGDRSEIPFGAPAGVAVGNFFGINYNATVSRDLIKFFRDVDLPILFIPVAPEAPHTIRLELDNRAPPTFCWFLDGEIVDKGLAESPFPDFNSRISWRGAAFLTPNDTMWDFFRAGVLPATSSGDWDSSGTLDIEDFYFFAECIAERGNGPGIPVDAGCEFADMDADGDVDFADFGMWQIAFSGD